MSVTPPAVPVFSNPALARYSLDAMRTTFRIHVLGGERGMVESAVSAAFQKIEELEGVLSRYVPGSDISRINALSAGESLFLSDDCDRCLRVAIEAMDATGGRFDPCVGTMIDVVKSGIGGVGSVSGLVSLDPERPVVTCVEPGRILDLGAIGKGFALECMSRILSDHGIANALLASGASTILAMGELEWPVDLAHSSGTRRIQLRGGSLAASGTSEQGDHIVNPVDGSAPKNFRNVWVLHPSATMADAFSTACFVMNDGQIREFLANVPCECQVITDPDWE